MSNQKLRPVLAVLFLSLSLLAVLTPGCNVPNSGAYSPADGYMLCFWNLENFFDDVDDGRRTRGDREYDAWFAQHPEMLQLKLSRLSDALLRLNGGRGPDILAVAEVESLRAAQLLADALNKQLSDPGLHYRNILMKEIGAGRHISPAILTRLPVQRNRTRLRGKRLRILEGHILVDGHELVVIASHWTSRVRGRTEGQRAKYGDQIYGAFKGMFLRNPKVDFLVCGDFNDNPDDPSVTDHLRAVGDRQAVLKSQPEPLLLNLMAGKDTTRGWGTEYNRGRWSIFDQIAVSPGLLDDSGWSCDPDSVQVINALVRPHDRKGRPWRFGTPRDQHERGYSDHFPVTVRLQVHND